MRIRPELQTLKSGSCPRSHRPEVVWDRGFCLMFGAGWFSLVVESLPGEEQNGVELPDEVFLGLPKVQEFLGILIYGVAILPGLAMFYAGQWVLERLGIPVWVRSEDEDPSAT